jgi:hypothetical protein
MTIQDDIPLLVRHSYMALTTRLMREGKLIDPAGTASILLRHFDAKVGVPDNAPAADG